MKKRTFMLLLFLCCFACNSDEKSEKVENGSKTEMEFDQTKWKVKNGFDYPYRNEMLEDLMNNQGLRKLKRDEILHFLGEPDRIDANYLFYRIEQKRLGLWPLHTKTMVIQFDKDSTVNWIKIHE